MKFNSYEFLLAFLPLVVAGFYLLGASGRQKAALAWLTGASLTFYAYWNPVFLILLGLSILFNFALGRNLAARAGGPSARPVLILGVAVNLGLLGYFKYANFLVDSLNVVTGAQLHLDTIILPLAISFFTFQQIAYLADAARDEARDYSLLHYALFVSFFPQLIAGPIVHHKEMMPQFDSQSRLVATAENFAVGIGIFIIGLAKKTLVADELTLFADPVFSAADAGLQVSFIEAWGGVLAYTYQIYFDFSGYSDMAIGLARLFGIRLPLNFHSPYKACSIIEFWRLWHMTLSRFLRDYLYIPLGGNRGGALMRSRNLMVVMLLGGLWHGAGWTFVIWGGLHGLYLIVNAVWRGIIPAARSPVYTLAAWTLTFFCVTVAWVFFRAETLTGAWTLLDAMLFNPHLVLPASVAAALGAEAGVLPLFFGKAEVAVIGLAALIAFLCPNTQQIAAALHQPMGEVPDRPRPPVDGRLQWRLGRVSAVAIGALGALCFFALARTSAFLYFNF